MRKTDPASTDNRLRTQLGAVHRVYLETGHLLEKYDVAEFRPGGGGEYATQDGFGWTNATYVTLRNCFPVADATK